MCDFPFVSDADRAGFLSMLLTAFVRPMIDGPTPLFGLDAPAPGTGKGLLAEVFSEIVTGRPLKPTTCPRRAEEWPKKITSALASAPAVVALDNVPERGGLKSEDLAAVLTCRVWSDRILGVSRTCELPNRAVWLATGNRLSGSGEIQRRTVPIMLDANCEKPAERGGFKRADLLGHVRANRPSLVRDCLTLCAAGLRETADPPGAPKMGSFERWCSLLARTLHAAGVPGFLGNRNRAAERADDAGEWPAFVAQWWAAVGGAETTARELARRVLAAEGGGELLADTLENFRGSPAAALGRALTADAEGVVLAGPFRRPAGPAVARVKVVKGGRGNGGRRWRLLPLGDAELGDPDTPAPPAVAAVVRPVPVPPDLPPAAPPVPSPTVAPQSEPAPASPEPPAVRPDPGDGADEPGDAEPGDAEPGDNASGEPGPADGETEAEGPAPPAPTVTIVARLTVPVPAVPGGPPSAVVLLTAGRHLPGLGRVVLPVCGRLAASGDVGDDGAAPDADALPWATSADGSAVWLAYPETLPASASPPAWEGVARWRVCRITHDPAAPGDVPAYRATSAQWRGARDVHPGTRDGAASALEWPAAQDKPVGWRAAA